LSDPDYFNSPFLTTDPNGDISPTTSFPSLEDLLKDSALTAEDWAAYDASVAALPLFGGPSTSPCVNMSGMEPTSLFDSNPISRRSENLSVQSLDGSYPDYTSHQANCLNTCAATTNWSVNTSSPIMNTTSIKPHSSSSTPKATTNISENQQKKGLRRSHSRKHTPTSSSPKPNTSSSAKLRAQGNARGSRISHSEVEKKYRDRLNNQFERLLAALPCPQTREDGDGGPIALSRAAVLDMARRRILALEEENKAYQALVGRMD
jgi:hypothetical protein